MALIELNQQNKRTAGVIAILIAAAYCIAPVREIIKPVVDFQFISGNTLLTPITAIAVIAIGAAILAKDRNL